MSILKTFRNLKLSLIIVFVLLMLISLVSINIDDDLKKINLSKTINDQSHKIFTFDKSKGDITRQLLSEHLHYMSVNYEKIKDLRNQDYVQTIFSIKSNEPKAFNTLLREMTNLKSESSRYYEEFGDNKASVVAVQKKLTVAIHNFNASLTENLIFKNRLIVYLSLATLIDILLIFIWYARKLSLVYRDIKTILNVDEEDRTKTFKTSEFTAIKRRMERRPMAGGGKNLLDPLTGILNEKGLISEYVQRGAGSSKEYVCVTMFDIDNFKELAQNYGKTFTDSVVKKIASILDLEKKPSDVIGRIGEDQFIIITARTVQSDAFTSVDNIRQTIEKLKFKVSSEKISVTVSGGFAPKDKHEKIESAISNANALVKRAKIQGKNLIVKQQGFSNTLNDRM